MALGDALSLSAANRLHESEDLDPREVFRRNHPGGAIGIANNGAMSRAGVERMRTLAVCWEEIPIADAINATDAPGMAPPSPAMSEASSESGMVDWDSGSGNSAAEQATNSCNGLLVLDCLRMAVRSPQGWLRTSDGGIISPKKLRDCLNIMEYVTHPDLGLVLDPSKQIRVPADSSVKDIAKQLVMGQVADDTVIVVLDNYGKVHGVMEAGDIIRRCGH